MEEQQSLENNRKEKAEGGSCQESLFQDRYVQEQTKEITGEIELEKWTKRIKNGS